MRQRDYDRGAFAYVCRRDYLELREKCGLTREILLADAAACTEGAELRLLDGDPRGAELALIRADVARRLAADRRVGW